MRNDNGVSTISGLDFSGMSNLKNLDLECKLKVQE